MKTWHSLNENERLTAVATTKALIVQGLLDRLALPDPPTTDADEIQQYIANGVMLAAAADVARTAGEAADAVLAVGAPQIGSQLAAEHIMIHAALPLSQVTEILTMGGWYPVEGDFILEGIAQQTV